jgi:peptidoglycan/LPS O-acetylase OafA/YrhL
LQTFAELGDTRENNFDFLRYFMAALVVYAHAFAFVNGHQYTGADPLARLTKWQTGFGGLAVECFFIMSGYMILRSWLYSKGALDYFKRRALRILPALTVALLFCSLVVGPIATRTLNEYFTNPYSYRYMLIMFGRDFKTTDWLPGVFENHPWPRSVNGSIWTIRYEIICYVGVALLGLIGIYRKRSMVLAIGLGIYALYVLSAKKIIPLGPLDQLPYLMSFFMVGMLAYLYRERIPHSPALCLLAVSCLLLATFLKVLQWVMPFGMGYLLFYIAFHRGIRLQHFARKGDLSYGVYIYAFPVQQLLVHFSGNRLEPHLHFVLALAISSGLAKLSWNYVEQPFIRMKSKSAPKLEIVTTHAANEASPSLRTTQARVAEAEGKTGA